MNGIENGHQMWVLSNGRFLLWTKFGSRQKERNHYHSWKEHLKMSKIAKFGSELL
jgi:hypothetical protein